MVHTNKDFSEVKQKYAHVIEEEEDNDGHGKHDDQEPQSNIVSAATQIANTIMGAGILNLPLVMKSLGLPLGIIFIILIALVTIYSVYILLECSENTGRNTCKTLVKGLISDPENDSFFTHNYNNFFYILIIFVLMSFLIFKESIDSLKKASFLGVLGITTFFITFIFMFIYKLNKGLIPDVTSDYFKPNGETTEILASLPTVFLAFTFQFNVFPIYLSLKSKKKVDMVKSAMLGVGFCLVIYLITGIVGLIMYGIEIKGSVLTLLEKDIEMYKETDSVILVSVIIINIAFLLSSTMSIPLMFFSLKKNFINSVIFCKKKFSNRNAVNSTPGNSQRGNAYQYLSSDNDGETPIDYRNEDKRVEENLLKTVDENYVNNRHSSIGKSTNHQSISDLSKNSIIISLYILITSCTILVPGLDTIFSIVGSTAANSISFILPNTFAIYLRQGKNILSKILLFIGVIVLIVCLISEIIKIFVVNKH